jgi:hypothetical protein
VSVYPYLSSSEPPGGTASFAVFVWTTNAASTGTTLTVSVNTVADVDAPSFAVCPSANGDVCDLGSLPTGQSSELVAGSDTTSAVASGTKITLTATAKASGADSDHADATVSIVSGTSSSSSSSTSGTSLLPSLPGSGFSLPGGSLPDGSYTTPTNPSGLFPTVGPGNGKGSGRTRARNVQTDSATLPLDSRLIGWQLAGLVVLAGAIAMAVARLSLRQRPHDGPAAAPR